MKTKTTKSVFGFIRSLSDYTVVGGPRTWLTDEVKDRVLDFLETNNGPLTFLIGLLASVYFYIVVDGSGLSNRDYYAGWIGFAVYTLLWLFCDYSWFDDDGEDRSVDG